MQTKIYEYKGKPTNYVIYDNGQVQNYITDHFLKGNVSRGGYIYFDLNIGDLRVRKGGHQLVAECFIQNPENKPVVNHKDGNKLNNDYANLEWTTYSENMYHAYKTGLIKPLSSDKVHFTKYSNDQIKEVCEYLSRGMRPIKIEKLTGVNSKVISDVRSGRLRKDISKNYTFKYPKYAVDSDIWDEKTRDRIMYLLNTNHSLTPTEIMDILCLPKSDKRLKKAIGDWKYRLGKVQRPSTEE